jgi:hypothetical protein
MEAGGGEERCIQGVIRMMVGEDNVGHVLGADAKHGKWVQDGLRAWHQSRVHDDDCVPIANKSNGGGHAMVQVALEQDVDLSHRLRIRMSMPRRRLVSRAIVGLGTRRAWAISPVLRPPSVRSVSATWPSVASAG